jgi:mRNA interferase RelE/StbE
VVLLPKAERELARLPPAAQSAVLKELRRLEAEPRHRGVLPVRSEPGWLRARVGDFRVIFAIDDRGRRVAVKRVVRRDKAYRG